MSDKKPLPVRLLKGFAMFWWDFLVGDTPELFVSSLVIIGVVAGLRGAGANTAAVIALPVLAVCALSISLKRAVNAAKKK
jgi:hypothetical protein